MTSCFTDRGGPASVKTEFIENETTTRQMRRQTNTSS